MQVCYSQFIKRFYYQQRISQNVTKEFNYGKNAIQLKSHLPLANRKVDLEITFILDGFDLVYDIDLIKTMLKCFK